MEIAGVKKNIHLYLWRNLHTFEYDFQLAGYVLVVRRSSQVQIVPANFVHFSSGRSHQPPFRPVNIAWLNKHRITICRTFVYIVRPSRLQVVLSVKKQPLEATPWILTPLSKFASWTSPHRLCRSPRKYNREPSSAEPNLTTPSITPNWS